MQITNLNNGQRYSDGVVLTSPDYAQCSSNPLTISNKSVYHLRGVHCHPSLTIEPGSLILYSPGGMLISKASNATIGTAGENLKVTFYPIEQLKSDVSGTKSPSFLHKLRKSTSPITHSTPLVLYDDSFMDFNADDDTQFYTASEMPIFDGKLKSTKSTAAGNRNSKLTLATGILKDVTIGGGGDAAVPSESIYPAAQFNNVNFAYSGLMLLGANAKMNAVNFYGGHQQLTAIGGRIESTDCSHIANDFTNRLIQLRGGAQYVGFGNNYDQSLAALPGYKGIEVKDAHVANDPALIPQLILGQSLFTMGTATGNDVSRKDMLSISAMNNVSGGGVGLYLFQNLIDMPAAIADLTDDSIRFADINHGAEARYGTASHDQSVLNKSIMLSGLTFNGNGASTASLIEYGVGLGNTTAHGDGTNYGTGTVNFPISLEDAALGIMPSDFINTNLAVVIPGNSSTPANMAENYTAYYKPLAANQITYYTAATRPAGRFYSHLLGMPKEMSAVDDLSFVGHDAYTSQLASTTLLPVTDDAQSSDIFRVDTAKKAFNTGANTLTGYEMFKFVELLTEQTTPQVNSTFTKLKTKS